jgi:hypothetical protein
MIPQTRLLLAPRAQVKGKVRSLRFMAIYRSFNNGLSGFDSRFFERLTLAQDVFLMI